MRRKTVRTILGKMGVSMQEEIKKEQTTPAEEVKEEKTYITIDDFQKVEIRVGTVISVDVVEGADKLYILKVDLGEESPRQILSGIREYKQVEDLLGKQFPFVTNLAPRMLRGYESQGMILAGSDEGGLALLNPTQSLVNGTRLR